MGNHINQPTTEQTLKELQSNLQQQLEISTVPQTAGLSYLQLRQAVIKRVEELLDRDPEQLMQLLYRIDVPEQKLRYALSQAPAEQASTIVADMLLERQLQKIETRKKFSDNTQDGDWEFDI